METLPFPDMILRLLLLLPAAASLALGSAAAAPPEAEPLVAELKGLVMLSQPSHARPQAEAAGLVAAEVPLLLDSGFQKIAAAHLGKPVSLDSLNALSREVVGFFRDHDRPVVDVSVPEQDITNGVVQMVVVEGRLGLVRVEGNRWISAEALQRGWSLAPGSPLRSTRVLRELDWLNENPFRNVEAVYTPGREFGLTDVILKVQDRFPLRAFAGYENSGTELTGEDRLLAGLQWGNAFGLDHQFSYQFMADAQAQHYFSHLASYVAPLPWKHRLRLTGFYATTSANLAAGDSPLALDGESFLGGMRYEIPLPGTAALKHEASLGFDYKRTTDDLLFNRIRAAGAETEVFAFSAGYRATLRDDLGGTSFTTTAVYSPGGWSDDSTDAAYEQVRSGASAEFFHVRTELERLTRLPADFSLLLRASGQLSTENLLPSEQLFLGGWNTVRGYEEFLLLGDDGLLLSAEIRSPSLHPLRFCKKSSTDSLQLLTFWDYGTARLHDPLPEEPGSASLMSVGAGLRYEIGTNFSVRFDYGWALEREPGQASGRGHLGVVLAF